MIAEIIQQGWRPAVEILILAAGIYYVLMFLRGTRAAPVVVGFLALVLALFGVAAILNLQVLTWMLGAGTAFLAVAALIIFQPEIRRLLARVGNLQMFQSAQERRESIEIIIQAAERMAEARIGALMAIERSINLQEIVDVGVPVDCEATPEMLETIFFPNNAIHDGGVVIRGDRIVAAACIFPLTHRSDLQRSLGTRHRAAIGLAEETDAVVVIVSEETGAISYAQRGHLHRAVTVEELRSFLSSVFLTETPPHPAADWLRLLVPAGLRRAASSALARVTGK
ncbi:MAG: diadenylate cyclase CdaA [Limisphaerales bacterium]